MTNSKDPDSARRTLLASVLAGGAVYALPVVATLSKASPANAQAASSEPSGSEGSSASSEPSGSGRPDTPGESGNGPEKRPAEPGEGGRGRNTGDNPHHGGNNQSSDDPGASASESSASVNGVPFEEIGPGGRGFA